MALFHYSNHTALVFGIGALDRLDLETAGIARNCLIVSGRRYALSAGIVDRARELLVRNGHSVRHFGGVPAEPEIPSIESLKQMVIDENVELLIAIGGGSVLDASKAAGVLARNPGPLTRYEAENTVENEPVPLIAVPTTSGSGSEHTRYAVLKDPATGRKFTIKSTRICPHLALVDPELTRTLPPTITVASGLDAFAHGLEAFLHRYSTPLTDAMALEVMSLVWRNLVKAVEDPDDLEPRKCLSMAATMGGMLINNLRTGLMHTMSTAISARSVLPHGMAVAVTIPAVLDHLRSSAASRLACVQRRLDPKACEVQDPDAAKHCITIISEFLYGLGVPEHLAETGIDEKDTAAMVERVFQDKGLGSVFPGTLDSSSIEDLFSRILS